MSEKHGNGKLPALGFMTSLVADKNVLAYNVSKTDISNVNAGPLLDDGAPFSSIGKDELKALYENLDGEHLEIIAKPEASI